jgi:hypothetical protein
MSVDQDQLDSFHQFATQRIRSGEAASMDELVDAWSGAELSKEQLDRNATAIQEAIDDMEAGDTGRPASEVIGDIRAKHGLSQR